MSPEGIPQSFSSEEEKNKDTDQESVEKVGGKKGKYIEGDPSKGMKVQRLGDNLSEESLKKIEKMKKKQEK